MKKLLILLVAVLPLSSCSDDLDLFECDCWEEVVEFSYNTAKISKYTAYPDYANCENEHQVMQQYDNGVVAVISRIKCN